MAVWFIDADALGVHQVVRSGEGGLRPDSPAEERAEQPGLVHARPQLHHGVRIGLVELIGPDIHANLHQGPFDADARQLQQWQGLELERTRPERIEFETV